MLKKAIKSLAFCLIGSLLLGNTVLADPKPNVVAGTLAVVEILDALEYDNVSGVPETSYKIPERYKGAPKIGKPMKPDAEVIKSLNPDLFISVDSLKEANEKGMDQLSINSLFINLDNVPSIKENIVLIGEKTGTKDKAEELISKIEEKLNKVKNDASQKNKDHKPKVLFIFGTSKSILTGTSSSYVGSLINELGAENVADKLTEDKSKGFVPLNMEKIMESDPDVIIRMTLADPMASKKMMDKEFSQNETWSSLRAVKEGRVIDLENEYFSTSGGIKVAESLEKLFGHIYGEK